MKILVIDNIDSFVYNIVQYLGGEGADPIVLENTSTIDRIRRVIEKEEIEKILISPGPKSPKDAGASCEAIKEYGARLPILGVCLGHQCIGYVYGAKIRQARTMMHGKTSQINHFESKILFNLPNPFDAVRYHSLVIDDHGLPKELKVTAVSDDDKEIMAIEHKEYPVYGIQFHPESVLTVEGKKIIKNFLDL